MAELAPTMGALLWGAVRYEAIIGLVDAAC